MKSIYEFISGLIPFILIICVFHVLKTYEWNFITVFVLFLVIFPSLWGMSRWFFISKPNKTKIYLNGVKNMNALQIIAVLGILVIAIFFITVPKTFNSFENPDIDQIPIIIEKKNISHTPNTTISNNMSYTTNETNISNTFNVSISFIGFNDSNLEISVEIPESKISGIPIISCNDLEFIPIPMIGDNQSVYFYECNCTYLQKASLKFNNYIKSFYILKCGNGWDFTLNDTVI